MIQLDRVFVLANKKAQLDVKDAKALRTYANGVPMRAILVRQSPYSYTAIFTWAVSSRIIEGSLGSFDISYKSLMQWILLVLSRNIAYIIGPILRFGVCERKCYCNLMHSLEPVRGTRICPTETTTNL